MNNKITVMLVEDHKAYRESLANVLVIHNIDVTAEAENGQVALKLLKLKKPDVVILDIEMPELNGCKTLEIIKEEFPEVKVIIMSQYDEEELIKNLFNKGANAYLPKSTDIEELVCGIKAVKRIGYYKANLPSLKKSKNEVKRRQSYKLLYSKREIEVIHYLCKAKTVEEIANKLGITKKAVEVHLTEIYKKTEVKGRAEFLIYAIKTGLDYLYPETTSD